MVTLEVHYWMELQKNVGLLHKSLCSHPALKGRGEEEAVSVVVPIVFAVGRMVWL